MPDENVDIRLIVPSWVRNNLEMIRQAEELSNMRPVKFGASAGKKLTELLTAKEIT